MRGIRLPPAVLGLFIGVILLAAPARAQEGGALADVPLPGGLAAALLAVNDRAAPDRGQFLVEFIRRTYGSPITERTQRENVLRAFVAHLDAASRENPSLAGRIETLPLPLTVTTWTEVVFSGKETPQTLVSAILRTRGASLLYVSLLSLDDETRAWIANEREFLAEVATRHAPAFAIAAPGVRVTADGVRLPGGDVGAPAWEALVGRRAREPADFLRAVLTQGDGRLAYFLGAMAQLTPAQLRVALSLDIPDARVRVAALRRLYAVFERIAPGWRVDEQTFWRPVRDPSMLIAELPLDDHGQPRIPGTRRFWAQVFGDEDGERHPPDDVRALVEGEAPDFPWLAEHVFTTKPAEHRRRYQLVLFASRTITRVSPESARDAVDAVRAAGTYPALVAVLERAKLTDVAAYARAARRARQLSTIGDEARVVRALTQFQGVLALVARAASQGSLTPSALAAAVSSLSAVDVSKRGDYEGRMVRWLDTFLRESLLTARDPDIARDFTNGPVDQDLLRLLSGTTPIDPRVVDWEGARYRLDPARAETVRLGRLLGDDLRPYLSAARALEGIADALENPPPGGDALTQAAEVLDRTVAAVGGEGRNKGTPKFREVAESLRRATRAGGQRDARRLAPAVRELADDLAAHGLREMVYAIALGQPDRGGLTVLAGDAADRHDFGLHTGLSRDSGPWQFPEAGSHMVSGWRTTGSLLGLDVTFAHYSMRPLSMKFPSKRPALNDVDRKVLMETAVLVDAASLTDADRDAIVGAIRAGRARLATIRTRAEAAALADEIPLGTARRTLLPWIATREPARLAAYLSLTELLWLGLGDRPVDARLHAWGASDEPRTGCRCLRIVDRRPWETLAGRWRSGIFASAFSDLNLRLAELLAELRMPASLLGPVLESATLDLVDTANVRDDDDRRSLVEFVQSLTSDRVEQYLALLTTDGPLVPAQEARGPASGGRR